MGKTSERKRPPPLIGDRQQVISSATVHHPSVLLEMAQETVQETTVRKT